jgi:hypothetical protein
MNSPACLRLISQISAFKIIAVVSSHNKKTNAFISESSFIHEFDSLVDFFQDCNLLSNFFAIFSNGPEKNVIIRTVFRYAICFKIRFTLASSDLTLMV